VKLTLHLCKILIYILCNLWSSNSAVTRTNTGDSRCMRFRYWRFRISTVLFQYHEEHQYRIRGYCRSCRAGALSCACSFTDSPHHFDFRDYKLRPLIMHQSENPRACYTVSRFTRSRYTRRFAGMQPPCITRVTCTYT
jgi:hypothetical protein